MKDYSRELEVAKAIAEKAGKTMLEYFDADQKMARKLDDSPVTIADTLVNTMVIQELKKAFPEDGVIGEEESTSDYGMGRMWFCDPIDGTKAYTWGVPTAMFSLGLVVDGIPVMGVAYDPFLDKLYSGVKGHGSVCNGQSLKVSSHDLANGLIAVTSRVESISAGSKHVKYLLAGGARLITFNGAVYKATLVAKGRTAGYVEDGVNAFDVAAINVIVEEAGGKVTGLDGKPIDYSKPFKGVIVSNGVVHDDILKALRS